MKTEYLPHTITYTGEQLRSHFAYEEYGIAGDSIIGFQGPCDIAEKYMVDIEDKREGERIYSEDMLHFIIEHHDTDLEKAILRQWLFAVIVQEVISRIKPGLDLTRRGSDLYDNDKKLSISVATVSPLSTMIHFGINVISRNTPVRTKGLNDYGVDPEVCAQDIMRRYVNECEDMQHARHKVTWVE